MKVKATQMDYMMKRSISGNIIRVGQIKVQNVPKENIFVEITSMELFQLKKTRKKYNLVNY